MSAIEIMDIHKTFPGKRGNKVNALKGLSLTVDQGEVFGFLGPNGAGKTTTIKILMGLIRPSGGQARIMGHDAGSHRGRKQVGYLPENPAYYDYLTAREYLLFVARTFGMNKGRVNEKIEELLRLLELWDARDRTLRGYSKGMVQRLGLAQALIHDPDVYVLDEPMSGLDPLGRALIKKIILDLRAKGKCVFFSTHITSDVEAVCDRVGIVLQGTLREVERIDSIMAVGLMGYQVLLQGAVPERRIDRYVPKDDLPKFMKETFDSGMEIVHIEPKRKDLESFFLDIVKGNSC